MNNGEWILEYSFNPHIWYTVKPYHDREHGMRALRRLRHVSANKNKTYRLRNAESGKTEEEPEQNA